mmetsp:Transcript_26402/g.45159  ORF Transcript_26402/g.45159 Transcript_26402/m.45159 type:complete len:209 (+) Transcript_26402:228-854(+)
MEQHAPTSVASKTARYFPMREATRAGSDSLRKPMRHTQAAPMPSAIVASPSPSPRSSTVERLPTRDAHRSAPSWPRMKSPFLLNMCSSGSLKSQILPPSELGANLSQFDTTGISSASRPAGSRVRSSARTTLPRPAEQMTKGIPSAVVACSSSTKPGRRRTSDVSAARWSTSAVSGSFSRSVWLLLYHSCISGSFCSRVRLGSISMGW